MPTSAHVSRINVTPVKSLRLHHPEAVELERDGAREDRRFLLVDDGHRLYNGKRDTALVRATASWDPKTRVLGVTLPNGELLEAEPTRAASADVTVYGRQVVGHVVRGPWADALSDLVGRSLTLVEREDGAWATDSRPATLISRASLGLLDGDGRRFRMLLELDGLDSLEEEQWRNRRVRAGDATLLVGDPTPRCAVPSASPDTGLRDRDVLRELIATRGAVDGEPCLGVYAEVLEPGVVRVGDSVVPIP
jgi:MOSC domain-containing protein